MRWFNVGKIVNTHGLKGEVRVISTTDFPDLRYQIGNTLTFFSENNTNEKPLTIRTHRKHKNFDLLSFEGYDNVSEVEPLKGGTLKISEDQLGEEELNENEFYYHEIIGCEVFSENGEKIGVVEEILSPGANDVWVVRKDSDKKLAYIPYIESVVKNVDIPVKKITIHLLEGLIE